MPNSPAHQQLLSRTSVDTTSYPSHCKQTSLLHRIILVKHSRSHVSVPPIPEPSRQLRAPLSASTLGHSQDTPPCHQLTPPRHRALSIRTNKGNKPSASQSSGPGRGAFSFRSLRGATHTDAARRLIRIVKSQSALVAAHETAARERNSIATQLSEWAEQTGDEAVSDIADKVGVVLGELGEQEEVYSHGLEDARGRIKAIRNTERSVQPSREGKGKIADEIQKVKFKEPESTRLVVLEQELVRAEAENLVAEAQLNNVVSSPSRPLIFPFRWFTEVILTTPDP